MSAIPVVKDDPTQSVDFNDVFSLRRPKDAKAGLSSGMKSIAKVCNHPRGDNYLCF